MNRYYNLFFIVLMLCLTLFARDVKTSVDFRDELREWDGFGFNYVQTTRTGDFHEDPQEYGGFSILSKELKEQAVNLVFGDDGLRINLVKMFLDPLHQQEKDGPYDHELSTQAMREFVSQGLNVAQSYDQDISIVTTLYGPPAFMTVQKELMARDLDPAYKDDLVEYFVDWAKYLREKDFPLTAVSLHNEGEGWERWNDEGYGFYHMDYNMYWSPELVAEFIKLLRDGLDKAGLQDVLVAPGETWSWDRFVEWGYASAIANDPDAVQRLGLVTSHGFLRFGGFGRWKSENTPRGIDMIRDKKPGIHAWVNSMTWRDMGSYFIRDIYNQIYEAKVNGIIPWAGIKRLSLWGGKGDPNPGGALEVTEDGELKILKGYYFYKQVCQAGQAGKRVCRTISNESDIKILAFSQGHSKLAESFVVINTGERERSVEINVKGTTHNIFHGFRTSEPAAGDENYKDVGELSFKKNSAIYLSPGKSVTTFFAK